MRRLNKKLVALLLALFVLCAVVPGGYLLLRRARGVDVTPLLARAAELLAAGKSDEAEVYYKRVLQLDAGSDAAHLALGEMEEARGQVRTALERYSHAARLNAHNRTALLRLGALCAKHGLFEPLGRAADRLLALDPSSADAHRWKALALRAAGDLDAAVRAAQEAARLAPERAETVVLLAELHQARKRYVESENVYQGALAVSPQSVELLLGLGRLQETRQDRTTSRDKTQAQEKAKALYERACELAPDAAAPRVHLARLLASQGKSHEAEEQLVLAVQRSPEDKVAVFTYGEFLVTTGQAAKACEHLSGALQKSPEWHQGRGLLVEALLNADRIEAGQTEFEKLPAAAQQSGTGKYLQGRLLLDQGKADEAVLRLGQAVKESPRFAQAHFHLGLAYARQGQVGSARASFEQAAQLLPGNAAVRRQLALTSVVAQRHDAALAAARSVLENSPKDLTMHQVVAQALAAQGDLAGAAAALEAALALTGDTAAVQFDLAALRAAQGRWEDARRLLRALPGEMQSSTRARLLLARIWHADNQPDRAEQVLQEACGAAPQEVAPRALLASLYRERGEPERGRVLLETLARAESKSVEAQLALAAFHRELGQLEEALVVCRRAAELDPSNVAVADQTIDLLLRLKREGEALATAQQIAATATHFAARLAVPRVLVAQRRWSEAVERLEPIVRDLPHEAMPAYLLGLAWAGAEDWPRAAQCLRAAVREHPNWVEARYSLADALVRVGSYGEALAEAERVLAQRPDLRPARLIAAVTRASQADYPAALEDYLAAEPDTPTAPYYLGLANLYQRNGQHDRAEQALQKAQALDSGSPPVLLALLSLYAAWGKPPEALAVTQRLLAENPQAPFPQMLLGRQHQAAGRFSDAEQAYRKAIELNPAAPAPYLLLGDALLEQGRREDAERAYRQALDRGQPEARARMVGALIRSGSLAAARQEIQVGLRATPSSVPLLIEEARLQLVEATHGRRDGLEACRVACTKALEAAPSAVEAHLLLAEAYLAERPPGTLNALGTLQKAPQSAREDPRVRLRLAQLQLTLGNHDLAEKECRAVLRAAPANPAALQTLAEVLARREPERPPLEVARGLGQQFPHSPARPLILGRALAAEKKWFDAANAFRTCAAKGLDTLEAADGLVRALLALQYPAEAIAECQAFLQRHPSHSEAAALLGTTYLACQKPADAAKAYEAALRLAPGDLRWAHAAAFAHLVAKEPSKATAVCEAYLTQWPVDPQGHVLLGRVLREQGKLQEAERAFAKALEHDAGCLEALSLLTDLCAEQRRFAEAAAACRAYQGANPTDAAGWHVLGRLHARQGNLEDAGRCLSRALGLDRTLVAARFDLGNVHLMRKEYARAVEHFEQVVAAQPEHPLALNNLAWCLAQSGKDLDRARQLAAKALAVNPDSPSSLDTLGWICYARQELDDAIRYLQRSRERRPQSATTCYHLAAALAARGRIAQARDELRRALAISDAFPEVEDARALLTRLSSNPAENSSSPR